MKICIPVVEDKQYESKAYNHFGSAPFFLIFDTETEEIKTIKNGDLHHAHGMCQPLKALQGENVDAILVGGIGAGAINKLNAQGVKVFKVADGSVRDNMSLYNDGKLLEFTALNGCNHHGCGGHDH